MKNFRLILLDNGVVGGRLGSIHQRVQILVDIFTFLTTGTHLHLAWAAEDHDDDDDDQNMHLDAGKTIIQMKLRWTINPKNEKCWSEPEMPTNIDNLKIIVK